MQFADINDLTVIANEIKDRANKVSGATNGNFAALDSNGDLTDSGHKHSDYLTQHQDISGKADLDENGKLVSSQKPSYTKSEVGLGNVDNTSDATKKTNFTGSIASENTGFVTGGDAYTELAKKVDKVDGKGLSSNDYTTTEKDKLSGIAANAEVNQNAFSNVKVGSTTIASGGKTATLELEAGSNITLTPDAANKKVVLAATDTTYSDATTTVHGLMSAADKTKLDGISTGANKVESSETNGNIKIDTVETVVYDDAEIKEVIDTSYEETDYANPLSLTTDNAQNAVDTKIKLLPIQDLHGYDKPWVGGAGKNLLPLILADLKTINTSGTWTNNAYIIYGITYTVNIDADGNVTSIKVTGSQATGNANLFISNTLTDTLLNTNKLNGCPTDGGSSKYGIYCYTSTYTSIGNDFGSGATLSNAPSGSSNNLLFIQIANGFTIPTGGLTFYPMIRLSTESDATFQPYTNIASISGHDQIDILGCGKNQNSYPYTDTTTTKDGVSYTDNGNGVITLNNTATARSVFYFHEYSDSKIFDLPNGNYILSIGDVKRGCGLVLDAYNNDTWIKGLAAVTNTDNVSFTVDHNGYNKLALYLYVNKGTSVSGKIYPMVRLASDADSNFEPYTESNDLSIDLPSTVYGGVLDLESGELVVDKEICKVSDLTWSIQSNSQYGKFKSWSLSSKIYKTTTEAIAISEYYESRSDQSAILYNDQIYSNGSGDLKIRDSRYIDDADATAWIAACGNCKIVYRLADSAKYTLHLTPHQLSLLKAQNNLTTSQYTQIKVTYRNGVFATLEELSDTANGIYDEISGDTTTVSGNPINFTTREKQKSKSTIINLEPIQDLHGFTKPWVGGAGKNKFPSAQSKTETVDGLTFKTLDDGRYNIKGTTASQRVDSTKFTLKNDFTFPSDSNYSLILRQTQLKNVSFRFYDTNDVLIDYWTLSASLYERTISTFTQMVGKTCHTIDMVVAADLATIDDTVSVSIIANTESDKSYEPYENICPISGRSSVDIDGCGKNFIRTKLADAKLRNITGTWSNNIYTLNNITFDVETDVNDYITGIKVNGINNTGSQLDFALMTYNAMITNENSLPTGTYILSGTPSGINKIHIGIRLDSDNSYQDTGNGVTFNVDASKGQHLVFLVLAIKNGASLNNATFKPMIRSASNQNGLYEPYQQSTDLTITFGTTVYGGRLDVEKGELVVDRGYADLGDLSWATSNTNSSSYKRMQSTSLSNVAKGASGYNLANLKCDCYENVSSNATYTRIVGISIDGDNNVQVYDNVYNQSDSASAFKTAMSGHQLVYELATSQTIQLTPQQVQLLKGINNISTTGTTITVTFKNGSVAHLDDLPDFTDYDKEKLASIDTLAITLDLLTHTLVVTQDI